MKRFISKNKPLLILIMSVFLILILTGSANAATDKYIFIGDSRTYHMITYYPEARGNFEGKIENLNEITISYSGASYGSYFGYNAPLKNKLKVLDNAKSGTKVIIWLGVNDIAGSGKPEDKATSYVEQVKKLAKSYPKLDFYYISVTSVYEKLAILKYNSLLNNTRIDKFNSKLNTEIEKAKLSNLYYIDVNTEFKSVVGQKDPSGGNDGLHYTKEYYGKVSNLIYKKVNEANKTMIGEAASTVNKRTIVDAASTVNKNAIAEAAANKASNAAIKAGTTIAEKIANNVATKAGITVAKTTSDVATKVSDAIKETVIYKPKSEWDFNIDGEDFTVDDIKVLYEWCFDSKNNGLMNSKRTITLNGTKISAEATWNIMKGYVNDYFKRRDRSRWSLNDLYNCYIGWVKSKGLSTGSYNFKFK